jgi:hypothetical protein
MLQPDPHCHVKNTLQKQQRFKLNAGFLNIHVLNTMATRDETLNYATLYFGTELFITDI